MFLILATVMIGENLLETPKENEIENTQLKFRGLEKKKNLVYATSRHFLKHFRKIFSHDVSKKLFVLRV